MIKYTGKATQKAVGMITIKDIAKACRVSAATVSRALTDSDLLPVSTKERIKRVAKELGYVKNEAAIGLKTGVSKTLGVINFINENQGFSHYLFAEIMNGFSMRANELDYDIFLIPPKFLYDANKIMPMLKAKQLSGVIILSGHLQSEGLRKIFSEDFPSVAVDPRDEAIIDMTNCISSDNRKGMAELTEFVLEKGHRNIVFITGEDYCVTKERLKGFKDALSKFGVEYKDDMIVNGNFYDLSCVKERLDEILSRVDPPTCILYSDDYCAVHAYDVLRSRGYKIGEDISIAGFDGLELGKHLEPKLTTVAQRSVEIGKKAAEMLIAAVMGEKTRKYALVDTTLVATDSVKTLV